MYWVHRLARGILWIKGHLSLKHVCCVRRHSYVINWPRASNLWTCHDGTLSYSRATLVHQSFHKLRTPGCQWANFFCVHGYLRSMSQGCPFSTRLQLEQTPDTRSRICRITITLVTTSVRWCSTVGSSGSKLWRSERRRQKPGWTVEKMQTGRGQQG